MDEDVRGTQRRTINAMFEKADVRIAVVVVGEGLVSTLQRTVARGVALTSRRARIVKWPEEASAWIAPHLGVGAAEVRAVIDRARALR